MTRDEQLAIARKLVQFLRALNRPPKRNIRTTSGKPVDHHEMIRKRAMVELGVEFVGLPGQPWQIVNEEHQAIGLKFIGTCKECGEPFVISRKDKRFCSKKCVMRDTSQKSARRSYQKNPEKYLEKSRKWRTNNPEKRRETVRKWKISNPEKVREQYRRWYQKNHEKVRENNRKAYQKQKAAKELEKSG
jgi:hypothetical protein